MRSAELGTVHLGMKLRLIIAAILFTALGVWCLALLLPWGAQSAALGPSIRFVAFTNAALGAKEPILAIPGKRHKAALQGWFASGTNAAIFTITNRQSHTLLISAHGQLFSRGGEPDAGMAFLLQPTGFPEFFLAPGQEARFLVAFPSREGPWKLRLAFRRDSREHSVSDVVRGMLRALGSSRAMQRSPVESEWISSLPGEPMLRIAEPQQATDGSQPSGTLSLREPMAAGSGR